MLSMFFFSLTFLDRIRLSNGILAASGPDILGEGQVITKEFGNFLEGLATSLTGE